MKHYGDITKLNGADLPAVDVITGGSPCQDLSVAGKRAGLAGDRSGLFMEQIRVIKEMRQRDRDNGRTGKLVRPRYMVWENVPGAFSSNNGEDFRAVLEETANIADESAVIPEPPKGKWTTSGAIMGDGWSIAWRVLDAQFWGVPQRRRRIALVADFGGQSAPEIPFERKGVCWDSAQSGEAREGTAGDVEGGAGETVVLRMREGKDGGGKGPLIQVDKSGTLGTGNDQTVFYLQGNGIDRADTAGCNGKGWREDVSYTLNTVDRPAVAEPILFEPRSQDGVPRIHGEICPTLNTAQGGQRQPCVAEPIAIDRAETYQDTTGPLMANSHPGSYTGQDAYTDMFPRDGYAVRRLTPLEYERLQGYPDGWTDIGDWTDSKGKVHKPSDSARYKALGNSIALPPWRWVLLRITAQYERPATLGSLFDGIGGFPLIWERLNGDGACLWASEIEEFCIAVTRMRFERTVGA